MTYTQKTLGWYIGLNAFYWGFLALSVLMGWWPVMSISYVYATGAGVPLLDLAVQPVLFVCALMAAE